MRSIHRFVLLAFCIMTQPVAAFVCRSSTYGEVAGAMAYAYPLLLALLLGLLYAYAIVPWYAQRNANVRKYLSPLPVGDRLLVGIFSCYLVYAFIALSWLIEGLL